MILANSMDTVRLDKVERALNLSYLWQLETPIQT